MKYIVDRIEGEYAICEAEDRSMVDMPLGQLPPNIKEGDRIDLEDGVYSILPVDIDKKKRIQSLMDDLWAE